MMMYILAYAYNNLHDLFHYIFFMELCFFVVVCSLINTNPYQIFEIGIHFNNSNDVLFINYYNVMQL